MNNPFDVPPPRKCGEYSDMVRVSTRHYRQLCRLADEGSFTSLGQLLGAILDAALPSVRLVERPKYDVVLQEDKQ